MLSRVTEMSPKGKPKGRRIAAYVPEEIAVELEKWATEETRSLSGLVTHLLVVAVSDHQQVEKKGGEE